MDTAGRKRNQILSLALMAGILGCYNPNTSGRHTFGAAVLLFSIASGNDKAHFSPRIIWFHQSL